MGMDLKPVDFSVVAEEGCFVYCYLRESDLTPYYVGIASRAERPTAGHNVGIPVDKSRIRLMKAGLSWDEACLWEQRYISHYGRKDIGTGILRNLTDGGDGTLGLVQS